MSAWNQFAPATLQFCETLLDGWVRQPANTYSNIAFIIVGVLLWRKTPPNKLYLRIFSIGSICVGFTSALFHLSMTFVGQFFDVSSMFLTIGMLVVLNAMRLGWLPMKHIYRALFGLQFLAMSAMYIFQNDVGEKIFAGMVFFLALSEAFLAYRDRPGLKTYRWWLAMIATFLSASFIWMMDIKKVWCSPDNHWFNGHAAWHFLNALVVYLMYRFYEQVMSPQLENKKD